MAKLEISNKELYALIDDEDVERCQAFTWHVLTRGYVATNMRINGKFKTVRLHRFILNAPANMLVDHANQDVLDNRKINLRLCTPAQNQANTKRSKINKTGYKGVRKTTNGKYEARIAVNGKRLQVGTFNTAEEAYKAYCKALINYKGEFARFE